MVRGLLVRGCPNGQQPNYVDINGTMFVTCVKQDNTHNSMVLGLALGLGIGIPVLIMICLTIYCTCVRNKGFSDKYPIASGQTITVVPRRRWEDFINEGSYIRRIAQLLENEETIPSDIADYFVENFPDVWEKVNQPGYDFVARSAKLIKVLFDEQAKLENRDVLQTIEHWEEKLVDKAGGEFGIFIMQRVKKL
jgi:hypothetical protein